MTVRLKNIIRRLPNMSANRVSEGVATALAKRVAVINHDASSALTPINFGRSGSRGTSRVCIKETTAPDMARTKVIIEEEGELFPSDLPIL